MRSTYQPILVTRVLLSLEDVRHWDAEGLLFTRSRDATQRALLWGACVYSSEILVECQMQYIP